MMTEKQVENAIPSNEEANHDNIVEQIITRPAAYKTALFAAVTGIIVVCVTLLFVTRESENPNSTILVTMPDASAIDTTTDNNQISRIAVEYEAINSKLASLHDLVKQQSETQQAHRSTMEHEYTGMIESIQLINTAIIDLGEGSKEQAKRISDATSRLDVIGKDVQTLKATKRKNSTTQKPRTTEKPPFTVDAIDVWDGVSYVAVTQAGHVAFLKIGEQQSGWTFTHIDRFKGQVDIQGPDGKIHSVTVQR